MPEYTYHLVDVFTTMPFGGNQLAVFPQAEALTSEQMQQIANELNLSESSFVLPPENSTHDYRVRFFTPKVELPLAGHPTVGTAYVLAREKIVTAKQITFGEGVGPIGVDIDYDQNDKPTIIQMSQPIPELGTSFANRKILADLLSLEESQIDTRYPAQAVSAGVPFLYIPVVDLEAMAQIKLRQDVWVQHFKDFEAPHIFTFTTQTATQSGTVHSRMFAPAMGITEDPATGAASGPLGYYLVHYGIVSAGSPIISEQGFEMGRPSLIHIHVMMKDNTVSRVLVGGECVYIGKGTLYL